MQSARRRAQASTSKQRRQCSWFAMTLVLLKISTKNMGMRIRLRAAEGGSTVALLWVSVQPLVHHHDEGE
jgi:hypothetical protein